jgi:hypothetical protein
MEKNKQEHIRILEWFVLSECNTLRPLFLYCSRERVIRLEKACAGVSV